MRSINTHKVNPANDTIDIDILDKPGAGGANHLYRISGIDTVRNPSLNIAPSTDPHTLDILFQNGTIPESGVNGVTQEVLLAIIEDRLTAFQAGNFGCLENGKALEAVREAMHWLHFRTLKRLARGVEGTHNK